MQRSIEGKKESGQKSKQILSPCRISKHFKLAVSNNSEHLLILNFVFGVVGNSKNKFFSGVPVHEFLFDCLRLKFLRDHVFKHYLVVVMSEVNKAILYFILFFPLVIL